MLPRDTLLLLIPIAVFACVSLAVLSLLRASEQRGRVRRRFNSLSEVVAGPAVEFPGGERTGRSLDLARLGLNAGAQRRLRADLVRAGYFSGSALPTYTIVRLVSLVVLPLLGLLVLPTLFGTWGIPERIVLAAVLLAVGYYAPKAYLSRTQRSLEAAYRLIFPNFLDMLVVCVNAGLSLEAALDRAARELDETAGAFRANLDLMAGEMRAGKSTGEALKAMAERLGLPEARAFVALLQQSLELGTDVAQALTTFSDEMRDKRMSSAEEKAASLPPKLTIPLGLFIFPVVLIAVLAPAILKVMNAVAH